MESELSSGELMHMVHFQRIWPQIWRFGPDDWFKLQSALSLHSGKSDKEITHIKWQQRKETIKTRKSLSFKAHKLVCSLPSQYLFLWQDFQSLFFLYPSFTVNSFFFPVNLFLKLFTTYLNFCSSKNILKCTSK